MDYTMTNLQYFRLLKIIDEDMISEHSLQGMDAIYLIEDEQS